MKKRFFAVVLLCAFLIVSLPLYAQADEDFDRAVELYSTGKYEQAIDVLKDYVPQKPEPAAYWMIGYSLYKLKKFDEADKYFKDAYLIDPNFSPKQIEAFAPGLEELDKELESKLKEFEREVTVPEEQPPVMPTFEAPPSVEGIPAEQPAEDEQVEGIQQEQVPAQEPAQPQEPTPPAVTPQAQEPVPQAVTPPAQPMPERQVRPPTGPQQFPVPEGLGAMALLFAGSGMIMMIVSVVLYIYFSFCFFLMAKKLDVAAPWLAFIPIVQIWTFVAVAGKPWWWIILLFIPLVGAILSIYLWMCIAENMGKSKWLGLLILVPIVNFILPGYLAFSKSETSESFGGMEEEPGSEMEL